MSCLIKKFTTYESQAFLDVKTNPFIHFLPPSVMVLLEPVPAALQAEGRVLLQTPCQLMTLPTQRNNWPPSPTLTQTDNIQSSVNKLCNFPDYLDGSYLKLTMKQNQSLLDSVIDFTEVVLLRPLKALCTKAAAFQAGVFHPILC